MKYLAFFAALLLFAACSPAPPPPTLTPNSSSTPSIFPTTSPTFPPSPTSTPTSTPYSLPRRIIPEGFGVNIHFVTASSQEMDLLASTGFKFIRMDLVWEAVEQSRGIYYFAAYDALVDAMSARDIRVLFILDYGNPLYDEGLAPYTDEGRTAFARFAAAAATHYIGKGILWEIWNEPNLDQFWKPRPNAQDYAALASTTVKVVRQADPNAFIIGPAVCCFDSRTWSFMDSLGKSGILNEFDAVTIHPYGSPTPELAEQTYLSLRRLLEKYSPERAIPIYVGEWGFPDTQPGLNQTRQAEYLTRIWLTNLANDINLNIWYDWRDDCSGKTSAECHFGTVDYISMQPKPSYLAAQTLMRTLDGYQFERRTPTESSKDYLLLFSKDDQTILAAWTTGASHIISLPISGDGIAVTSLLGETSTLIPENGLSVELSNSPRYLFLGSQSLP